MENGGGKYLFANTAGGVHISPHGSGSWDLRGFGTCVVEREQQRLLAQDGGHEEDCQEEVDGVSSSTGLHNCSNRHKSAPNANFVRLILASVTQRACKSGALKGYSPHELCTGQSATPGNASQYTQVGNPDVHIIVHSSQTFASTSGEYVVM